MKTLFAAVAVVVSTVALLLPARSQTFTRVSVNGRAMRMLVTGGGESTVVFESGSGTSLEMWGKVQPPVSRFAKTVSYDRLGTGLSDDGLEPRDGDRIAGELREALRSAGAEPPYVLVGASLGGLFVRVFAGVYPADVRGMVLVDPTHDLENVSGSDLPELRVLPRTVRQAAESRIPPGVPLVLIDAISPIDIPFATATIRQQRAGNRPAIDAESRAYQAWLDTIPGARLVVTHESGHNVPIEQPGLVVDTIRQILQK